MLLMFPATALPTSRRLLHTVETVSLQVLLPPLPAPFAPPLSAALPALSACSGEVRKASAMQAMIALRM